MTFLTSNCSFLASLPMVVVLPAPLTPTTRITNGLLAALICSGFSTGRSSAASSSCSALYRAPLSASSLRATRLVRLCTMAVVASTPTSAVSRRVSISSSRSSSMAFLPRNRLAMPSPRLALVFDRPCLRQAKKLAFCSSALTTAAVASATGTTTGAAAGALSVAAGATPGNRRAKKPGLVGDSAGASGLGPTTSDKSLTGASAGAGLTATASTTAASTVAGTATGSGAATGTSTTSATGSSGGTAGVSTTGSAAAGITTATSTTATSGMTGSGANSSGATLIGAGVAAT